MIDYICIFHWFIWGRASIKTVLMDINNKSIRELRSEITKIFSKYLVVIKKKRKKKVYTLLCIVIKYLAIFKVFSSYKYSVSTLVHNQIYWTCMFFTPYHRTDSTFLNRANHSSTNDNNCLTDHTEKAFF